MTGFSQPLCPAAKSNRLFARVWIVSAAAGDEGCPTRRLRYMSQ
jgi:hypothetical protein